MSAGLSLVMPAAGRGSRFARSGIVEPKPLIDLAGRPFFWWAVESVRRVAPLRQIVFVVLEEHCRRFGIDDRIWAHYPEAKVIAIPDVTSGAAETARVGIDGLDDATGAFAINDCDHAFLCTGLADAARTLETDADRGILCFRSQSPAYSYAILDAEGRTTGTVEKMVASPYAVAGCYLFRRPALFRALYDGYAADCPYNELYVSGLLNRGDPTIARLDTERHWPFGTPEELAQVDAEALRHSFSETVL